MILTIEELYKNPVFAETMKNVPENQKKDVEKELLRLAQWLGKSFEDIHNNLVKGQGEQQEQSVDTNTTPTPPTVEEQPSAKVENG